MLVGNKLKIYVGAGFEISSTLVCTTKGSLNYKSIDGAIQFAFFVIESK